MQKEKTSKKTYFLFVLALSFLIVGLLFRITSYYVFEIFLVVTCIISGIAIVPYWRKKIEPKMPEQNDKATVIITVSSALYAIIAGFAIKNALEHTFGGIIKQVCSLTLLTDQTCDLTQVTDQISNASFSIIYQSIYHSQYEIFMGIAFLATAIPFYHGAMIFLSDKSSIVGTKTIRGILIHFVPLFAQSIVFLGLSFTLQSFMFSIMMLIVLMIIDSLWIIIGRTTSSQPPLGWLFLNIGFIAAIFLTIYHGWNSQFSSLLLAIICIIRTLIDYLGFTEMYVRH